MQACTYSSHNATPSITEQEIPEANTAVGKSAEEFITKNSQWHNNAI